jgi:Flp pilus assembly pilin Flp
MIQRFLGNCAGATAIEYALIALLLSLAAIGGYSTLANTLREAYTEQGEKVAKSTERYR